MPHDSWDNPDTLGRIHKQVCKEAKTYLKRAMKAGDSEAIMTWSVVLSRHTRDIVSLMQFKRLVMLDTDGMVGGKVPAAQGATQPTLTNSK